MMLLGMISLRFGEACLKELVIQSEVVAEGSTDKVLNGKNYNRAIRFHKITYEAVTRILVDAFESSLPENAEAMLSDQKKKSRSKSWIFVKMKLRESMRAMDMQGG